MHSPTQAANRTTTTTHGDGDNRSGGGVIVVGEVKVSVAMPSQQAKWSKSTKSGALLNFMFVAVL